MHNPTRLLWSLGVALLLTGACSTVAQPRARRDVGCHLKGRSNLSLVIRRSGAERVRTLGDRSPASRRGGQGNSRVPQLVRRRRLRANVHRCKRSMGGARCAAFAISTILGNMGRCRRPVEHESHPDGYGAGDVGRLHGLLRLVRDPPGQRHLPLVRRTGRSHGGLGAADSPGSTAWTISITDVTSHLSSTQQVQYDGPGSSAEWIEEAPTVNGQQSTLANYGSRAIHEYGRGNSQVQRR